MEALITDDKINNAIHSAMVRLDIPIDPTKANLLQAIKVSLMKETIALVVTGTQFMTGSDCVEVIRATVDAMELLFQENKK